MKIIQCRQEFEDAFPTAVEYKFESTGRYNGVWQHLWDGWKKCWDIKQPEIMKLQGWKGGHG